MARPAVRQMRGPGMNKGLKKPRHGKFPNPDAESRRSSGASGGRFGASGGSATSSGTREYGKRPGYDTGENSYLSPTISGRDWGG